MKILFLVRLYYPHVGGVEKHVASLSSRLSSRGHKVTVLTTKYKSSLASREKIDGVKIIRFTQPNIKFIGLVYTWLWLLKNVSLINKSDLIHCHDIFIWYLPFRFLFPKKPVFTTFHGRWGKYPIPKIDIFQKRIGAKLSTKIMCIGDYIPKNYGIKADIVSYGATDIPKRTYKKDEDLVIYVGRLDKDIALQPIFKVFDKIDGKRIEFCGDGELMAECMQYGKVHGFSDPRPFYQRAKYCFASGYLTIIEALVHKCLVFIAYNHPLHKDYYQLAPFSEFIVYSSDPNEIFKKFIFYSENPDKTQKQIKRGYEWAKSQTWSKLTGQYLQLWRGE